MDTASLEYLAGQADTRCFASSTAEGDSTARRDLRGATQAMFVKEQVLQLLAPGGSAITTFPALLVRIPESSNAVVTVSLRCCYGVVTVPSKQRRQLQSCITRWQSQ